MMSSLPRCRVQASIYATLIAVVAMALYAALPQKALGTKGHKRAPGIFLSGPLINISLNTPYTYNLEVVSRKSYKQATVSLTVPSACYFTNKVNLIAYRPWKKSYTVGFMTTVGMSTEGLSISVFSPSSSKGSRLLMSKAYTVTPAPNQAPSGSTPVCPKPWWIGS